MKRYISSPENALEMIMIGLVLWIITQNTEENVSFVPISCVSPCCLFFVLWIITQNTEENVSFVPISCVSPFVDADLRFPLQVLLNRHLAAIALVLSWAEMITLIGSNTKHMKFFRTM